MKSQKVFGIGFHRTGTTTLQTALEVMGYRVVGMRQDDWKSYVSSDFSNIENTIAAFDGFRDMPWPLLYRRIYETVPNAKFVLSYRDPESWARSCAGNYKSDKYEMFTSIYGFDTFQGNEEKAKEIYSQHIAEVRAFFHDKPGSFLEKDFTNNTGWSDLCEFLSEPEPQRRFPHANKRPKSPWLKFYHQLYRSIAPRAYKSWVRDRG